MLRKTRPLKALFMREKNVDAICVDAVCNTLILVRYVLWALVFTVFLLTQILEEPKAAYPKMLVSTILVCANRSEMTKQMPSLKMTREIFHDVQRSNVTYEIGNETLILLEKRLNQDRKMITSSLETGVYIDHTLVCVQLRKSTPSKVSFYAQAQNTFRFHWTSNTFFRNVRSAADCFVLKIYKKELIALIFY